MTKRNPKSAGKYHKLTPSSKKVPKTTQNNKKKSAKKYQTEENRTKKPINYLGDENLKFQEQSEAPLCESSG